MRFLVDSHLGKVAKLLRFLGFDAEIMVGDYYELAARALREGRVLLTRREEARKKNLVKALVFKEREPELIVKRVIEALKLEGEVKPFSRCPVCNVPLEEVSKEEVKGLVPPFVYQTHDQFSRCPRCGRVYWEGSHVEDIKRRLRSAGIEL